MSPFQEQHENELARSFEKFTIPSEEEGFQETRQGMPGLLSRECAAHRLISYPRALASTIQYYLRAAAPAADPGKEKPVMVSAGFVRVFCESSAWMLYIYIIYIYICIK